MKNWWYYHKWYVICGLIVLGSAINIIGNALGFWTKKPDFQIAYVGQAQLPPDTVEALEQAFASLASDFNGDGQVLVQINQYIDTQSPDADAAYYQMASQISLTGDITTCQSYFFLMEDPELFQRQQHILANPDGSCPPDMDNSIDGKVYAWADCPALNELELGSFSALVMGQEVSGSNQELVAPLFIGRRCFYTDTKTDYAPQCSSLWDKMIESHN